MCENPDGVSSAKVSENPNVARIIKGLETLVHVGEYVVHGSVAATPESIASQIVGNNLWIDGPTYMKIANLTQGELNRRKVSYERRNYMVNILQRRQIGDGIYGIVAGMKSNRSINP